MKLHRAVCRCRSPAAPELKAALPTLLTSFATNRRVQPPATRVLYPQDDFSDSPAAPQSGLGSATLFPTRILDGGDRQSTPRLPQDLLPGIAPAQHARPGFR